MKTVINGTFLHTPKLGMIEIFSGEIHLNDAGTIVQVIQESLKKSNAFYMPGLIDAHVHAPQFKNLGIGLDLPLLDWLHTTTFPTESTMNASDEEFYRRMARELLKRGTTTACYFGSVENEANQALVKAIKSSGQRAFVGKVCMDQHSPDYYCESTEESLHKTKQFIEMVNQSSNCSLIKPIITPRFAISCSMPLMKSLGVMAKECGDLPIQSHISENKEEIAFVKQLHPPLSYAQVYEEAGLLSPKTLLAHGVHLTPEELEIIKHHNCTLVHCADSNYSLNSGVARVRQWLDVGVNVALGTDVSGGSNMSMFSAMRTSILASKSINFLAESSLSPLIVAEVLYLATMGGAKALNIPVGSFEVGKQFDALMIEYEPMHTHADCEPKQHIMNIFHGFFYNGDDRHIKRVFVNGNELTSLSVN